MTTSRQREHHAPDIAPISAVEARVTKLTIACTSNVRFTPVGPVDPATPTNEVGLRRVAKLRDEYVAAVRTITRAEAAKARALAEIQQLVCTQASSNAEIDLTLKSRAAECAAALGISDRTVLSQMSESHTLVYGYPETFEACENTTITIQHAKVIIAEGSALPPAEREIYEARCLEIATETSPGRLRAKAKIIAEECNPRTIDERHRLAAGQRCIWVHELPDGMAELGAVLPAVLAYGIRDRLQRIAKAAKQHVERVETDAP